MSPPLIPLMTLEVAVDPPVTVNPSSPGRRFIPIVGEFVIPDLLGSSRSVMIGQTLWTEFFTNKDWPVASAVAVVLLVLLVVPIVLYQHMQSRDPAGGH